MQQALDILKQYWQHNTFREPQDEIIQSAMQGNDVLALMPTGGGKSICFQVPALMKTGLCLVISPLVALMNDQVQNLQKRGIKAIALTGGITADEISDLLDNCRFGNYKFLYLSPERLQAEWILERIKDLPVNLIAIDEAHCVSQWGHDFRPAFLKISLLRLYLPNVPFMALTASATSRVKNDIITQLGLIKPAVYQKSFARENIAYMVLAAEDKLFRMQQILSRHPGASIIYVRNRKSCHDVATQLSSLGYTTTYYHGGLTKKEKSDNMKLWMDNKAGVIVATNAFGMGIDKPDVKTVIHIQLPENLENYYQESGRAGRNGEKSYAVLLVNSSDALIAKNQFLQVLPDKKFLAEVYKRLNSYLRIAYGEGVDETFPFNLNEFCQKYQLPVTKAYNALRFLDGQGILTLSKEFSQKITIQFIVPSREVMRYISLNPADEELLLAILRNYTGIFEMETSINIMLILKKAKKTENELLALLERLAKQGIIHFRSTGSDSSLTFNEIREDDHTINRISKYLESQNAIKLRQFEAVINYVTCTTKCKSRLILEYFNEMSNSDCGTCSYCISLKKTEMSIAECAQAIVKQLQHAALSSRDLESMLGLTPQQTINALQLLVENEKIRINLNNQYTLS